MHTLRQKAIALAIEELAMQDNSPTKHMYVYNVCRFLEVCSQHVNSAIQVVKNGGIHRLIKAIDRFYQQVRDILRSRFVDLVLIQFLECRPHLLAVLRCNQVVLCICTSRSAIRARRFDEIQSATRNLQQTSP